MLASSRHSGLGQGRRIVRWLAGMVLALAAAAALAAGPRSLRFERLGLEHGLSQESVLTILQDRHGFIWFGTQAGLNRFDGYTMTVYRNDPDDPGSLPDNFVTASFEDDAGRLWFGTKGGLARFDEASQKFVRYRPPATSGAAAMLGVSAICSDGSGALWLGSPSGLRHFDPANGRFTTLRHDAGDSASLAEDHVNALALDGSGALWVGTGAGLDRLPRGARRFEHFRVDPEHDARRNTILSLSMGPRNTLWVGTRAGLEAWRLGEGAPQRRHVGEQEGMADVRVLALYHDAGGTLWVGTELDGLKWRDPAAGRFVSYRSEPMDRHSLSDNQVGAILVDRTGTLWVGTLFGGVNRVDLASGGFARYTYSPGQPGGIGSNKVRAVADAGNGRLWIGTTGGGLTRFDPASGLAEHYRHEAGRGASLPDDTVTSLANGDGGLWVGTAVGLAWRDAASGGFTPVPLGDSDNYVQGLRVGRDGTLWIATRNGLFARGPDGKVRGWRHSPEDARGLGENYVYSVLEDRKGAIWIGTDSGLDRLDRDTNTFTHFRHDPADPDSLRHNRVYYLHESARGELWVGTAGGLHKMALGPDGRARFSMLRIADVRDTVPVGAILEDITGQLWVSSTLGLSRVDPVSRKFKLYTAADGLVDGSFFVGSAWRSPQGELYFGGVNGMTSFMPSEVRDNPYAPPVLITDFQVDNRPRALGVPPYDARDITLSYRDATFSIEFAALHYADPRANRYAYRLDGFDQGWVDTGAAKRFATYTNLDPGRYVFRVRASNKDGVWSEAPTSLVITITPPFWKTWWFRTVAAALAFSAAYWGYRLRVRVLVQQKDRLERQVSARTAELVLQKEAAERRRLEVEQQKEVVEQAQRNIARLSELGRMLTANLDSESIMGTLYEQVRALMDAPVFGIALVQPERGVLAYPFTVVGGQRCPPFERPLAAPYQLGALCVATGREIFIGDLEQEWRDYLPDAPVERAGEMALPCAPLAQGMPRSVLMVPVTAGARVLGLVTVQGFGRNAWRRVHLDMLRTLAAYVGVALDNAHAYRQLKDTQAQLAAREKLASLGSLVAGVAHELNTPIGNSLLMASTLREKTDALAERFEAAQLRRSELEHWIAASTEASHLIERSLHGAADLVNSFRQVAVDQASAQQRRFDLAQACQEIAATMMKQVRLAGHTLELAVPEGIVMDSFPGPLGQIVINLVNNALLHAFGQPGGHMLLSAESVEPGRVRITFRDNGRGIDPAHLARVFEPFFTTRMGSGGTGLGLNIVYNIVTNLLGGTIRAEGEPGKGALFVLDLPLSVRAAHIATTD
ncbi:ATP-binding protein [Massilia solisilvae]|uniref:histidine kinase n=1 Tax=Massilia solisilvae TaxID=1811225 RepID=A0ABT2BM19_9BURK|nr:sensor histidine kinase [Massilia solisilvae]MCS0609564.1 ATP-binding protein [Massilia solisilvae]